MVIQSTVSDSSKWSYILWVREGSLFHDLAEDGVMATYDRLQTVNGQGRSPFLHSLSRNFIFLFLFRGSSPLSIFRIVCNRSEIRRQELLLIDTWYKQWIFRKVEECLQPAWEINKKKMFNGLVCCNRRSIFPFCFLFFFFFSRSSN